MLFYLVLLQPENKYNQIKYKFSNIIEKKAGKRYESV